MAGISASPGFSLTPSSEPMTLQTNYIGSAEFDFLRTELPDLYEQEFERYGDRSIASFLRLFSAEFPSTSDLIKWTEEGRLHTMYDDASLVGATGVITKVAHVFRVRQTVLVSDGAVIAKGIITAITADTFTVKSYTSATFTVDGLVDGTVSVFVYGSEFDKGTNGMQGSLNPVPEYLDNKPIIIKDKYEINGSDLAQIGWVEVEMDNGGMGYLWYLKANSETRQRFEDYLEMSMIEGVPSETGSGADTVADGTKGLFHEVKNRGNVVGGVATTLADWDTVVKRLDKQGAISENAVFCERVQDLAIDDMLASQNSYGAGGTSYGIFNNDETMALNLRFKGFHRGGYDFYKTSWKYLNDPATRGGLAGTGKIRGLLVPTGTKTIYDQLLGKKIALPFLHIKYRQAPSEDRKFKTWLTGSAGGANNSDLDAMQVQYLSERALITIGANNFVLFED